MVYKKVLLATLMITLTGCATAPSDIPAAMVDTTLYKKMSCERLLITAQNEGLNLTQVSEDQRSSRNWDIALNLLLLPGIGAMTADSEKEVAEAKGRVTAIQNEYAARCESFDESKSEGVVVFEILYHFFKLPQKGNGTCPKNSKLISKPSPKDFNPVKA